MAEGAPLFQPSGERELLEPRKRRSSPFLEWLAGPRGRHHLARSLAVVVALVAFALLVGTLGFRHLAVSPRLTWEQSFYHAVKLFTIDLGPAGGGSKTASGQPVGLTWPIRLAMLAALAVILRALLGVARNFLRRQYMRHRLWGHVIVCGGGVHGARLVQELAGTHDVVLIDPQASAPGMQRTRSAHEWRLVGDATAEETLRGAAVGRAHWIVAVTGHDYVSSQIASVVRGLAKDRKVKHGVHVLVQIEDPTLERFFEEADVGTGAGEDGDATRPPSKVTVTGFGGNAIAASALFGEESSAGGDKKDARLRAVEEEERQERRLLLLAGDHPLLEAIVLAALRRLRGEKLLALEKDKQQYVPTLRIGLIGPDAIERVRNIKERWQPEPSLLELEGKNLRLGEEDSLESDKWLLHRRYPGHALVACLEELDGIGLTLALSRALGSGPPLTRVTAQPESELDRDLAARTEQSPFLATTQVRSISDLAWEHDGIRRILLRERLVCALQEWQIAHPELEIANPERCADGLLKRQLVELRSEPAPRLRAADRALSKIVIRAAARRNQVQEVVPVSALARAGLVVDSNSLQNRWLAASEISRDGDARNSFTAWCDYAVRVPPQLALKALDPERALDDKVGKAILALRAITLLPNGGDPKADRRKDLLQHLAFLQPKGRTIERGSRVVILAGGPDNRAPKHDERLEQLLTRALLGLDGLVLTGPCPDRPLARAARAAADAHRRASPVDQPSCSQLAVLSPADVPSGNELAPLLRTWADLASSGFPLAKVRVVAFPGGRLLEQEIALARALGAMIVSVGNSAHDVGNDREQPFAASEILDLPVDAMTIRAYLVWQPWRPDSPLTARQREHVAQFFHEDYLDKQKNNNSKKEDDVAMQPWERLPPGLRRSNLSQADDIPNKLKLVGKQLAENNDQTLELTTEEEWLLAEVEHGRYNYERLSAGWTLGPRRVESEKSPYLKPWNEIDSATQQWDIDAVRNIGKALSAVRKGVEPLTGRDPLSRSTTQTAD